MVNPIKSLVEFLNKVSRNISIFSSCSVYVNYHYFSFTHAGYAKLGSGGVGKNPAAAKSAGTKTYERKYQRNNLLINERTKERANE